MVGVEDALDLRDLPGAVNCQLPKLNTPPVN